MTYPLPGWAGTIPTANIAYITQSEELGGAINPTGEGLHMTKLTLSSLPVTTNGGATNAIEYGGTQLYDFPTGQVILLAAGMKLTMTMDGTMSAYFNDATPEGDISIGSTLANSAEALGSSDTSDDDMINATAYTMAAYAVATAVTGVNDEWAAASAIFNGTSTAADAFLNLTIDANERDSTTAPTLLVSGYVKLYWLLLSVA